MQLRAINRSRERSCMFALRDGRCDNENATLKSNTFSYIGIVCGAYIVAAFWQSWCRSLFERAQLLGRAP